MRQGGFEGGIALGASDHRLAEISGQSHAALLTGCRPFARIAPRADRQRNYKCIDASRPPRHIAEPMAFEWDEDKREGNLVKHGRPLQNNAVEKETLMKIPGFTAEAALATSVGKNSLLRGPRHFGKGVVFPAAFAEVLSDTDTDFVRCYMACRKAGNGKWWCQHVAC